MITNHFQIPAAVEFALDRLHAAGYHAYVVGGCVRDFVMGRQPVDYDVTTSAKPKEIQSVFSNCRVVETGLKHGTLTLVHGGMSVEITTYRIDGAYLDGRHPENVTFTDNLADDLCRRDFTVNAMAYNPASGIIDLHGGVSDIENRVISCVGSAEKRFSEDGLRILRALRFSSTLDFTPDDECSAAIRKQAKLLELISSERIYAELTKLICGRAARRVLQNYPEVIAQILPGLDSGSVVRAAESLQRSRDFPQTHKLDMVILGYALLFSETNGSLCRRLMQSLKPSRDELRSVELLHEYGNRNDSLDKFYAENDFEYAVKLLLKHGDNFPKMVAVYKYAAKKLDKSAAARIIQTADEMVKHGVCVKLCDLKINGGDLIQLGFSGKNVGTSLDLLLDSVMRGRLENDREALIGAAKKLKTEG